MAQIQGYPFKFKIDTPLYINVFLGAISIKAVYNFFGAGKIGAVLKKEGVG